MLTFLIIGHINHRKNWTFVLVTRKKFNFLNLLVFEFTQSFTRRDTEWIDVRISQLYYLWRRRHTTVWLSDLGSSFLAVACLHLVTFLVVLELFFFCRLPWIVHSISGGLLLSLKFTRSPLQHATCHLFGNGRCKPQLPWLYGNRLSPTFLPHRFPKFDEAFQPLEV